MMSQEAISIALHADSNSIEPRRIAKSSNIIRPVWRMLKTLRPITMRRHRLDAFGDDRLLAGGDVAFAPAVEAVIGLDPAEQQILRAAGAEDEAFDARDLHGRGL